METGNKALLRLLDEVEEGIYFTDTRRRITFWNRAAEKISGYRKKEVIGKPCSANILIHIDENGRNLCTGACPLARTLEDCRCRETNIFLHHREGHRIPVRVRIFPLRDEKRRVIGAAELFSDSREKRELWARMRRLEKLASYDRLTGTANRSYCETYLQERLEEYRRFHWPLGIIFFDIDDFKKLNDRHSHRVGDAALKMVAQTLRSNIRSVDLVGRWGGEEFVIMLRNQTQKKLEQTAEKLRMLVERSFFLEKRAPVRVTVSGGATLIRSGDTMTTLVERADLLMYRSKQDGKNRISCD
jgi:diguanylate cyclase (GGDEF)-like protein/PAS domain S-box-containing protein